MKLSGRVVGIISFWEAKIAVNLEICLQVRLSRLEQALRHSTEAGELLASAFLDARIAVHRGKYISLKFSVAVHVSATNLPQADRYEVALTKSTNTFFTKQFSNYCSFSHSAKTTPKLPPTSLTLHH